MKITDLHINSFGHWNGLQLNELSEHVTVIHGPNEAGKSTLLQFIRAVLYGFSLQRHRRFIPPVHGGRAGGTISLVSPSGRFDVRRILPSSGRLEDHDRAELSVRSADGSRQGKQILATLLAGVDDSIFHNVFAVGLTEMQQLGTLSDTEAGQQLYGLAMGGDRVSLMDITNELQRARNELVSDESDSLIPNLLEKKERLRREIESASEDSRKWSDLIRERRQVEANIQTLEAKRDKFLGDGNLRQVTDELRTAWSKCQSIHRRYSKLQKAKGSKSAIKKIQDLSAQIESRRKKWKQIKSQRAKIKAKASELVDFSSLLEHAPEIESLFQQRKKLAGLDAEIKQLESKIDEIEFELQSELERVGVRADVSFERIPPITDESISILRNSAREAKQARDQIEQYDQVNTQLHQKADELQRQLRAATAKTGSSDFDRTYKRTRDKMEALRQKMQLDTKQQKLRRKMEELNQDVKEWREREVLPWRAIIGLGLVFSTGFVLLSLGLLGKHIGLSADRSGMLMLMGVCGLIVAPGIKKLSELSAGRGADACERRPGTRARTAREFDKTSGTAACKNWFR